ncbi:MAG: fibronectin type III domain-containing protein, partial [Alteromonas sp.]|nr:fibronectin type III domain-containing protein [Alteromonas sp.]
MVVDVVSSGNAGTFTATGSGMNEQFDVSPDGASAAGSTLPLVTSGTKTVSWQHSATGRRLAHSVAAFEPATPDVNPPTTPANLTATAVSGYQIDLSWDASTGVAGYKIYRDGGGTPIATVTGTTYQDTGLSQATLYTYKVSAIDAVPNESAQSSQASDTTGVV